MSRSLNKVMLIGTVGKDPECRTAGSFNIVNLSVATQNTDKDKTTGAYVKTPEWHKVVLFGKLADLSMSFIKKGSLVYIEGRLKTSKYTSKDGLDRYSTDIVASSLTLLDKKQSTENGNNNQENGYGNYKPSHQNKKPIDNTPDDDFGDDDIPFN